MKKLYLIGTFILLCSMAFNNQLKASVDFDFHVQITDNNVCHSNPYGGTYHIYVEFVTNDVVECSYDFYTTSTNPEVAWTCGVTFDQYKNHYIRLKVCHWNSLTGDWCCSNGGGGAYTMTQLQTGGGTTIPITVN
jgi:catalase (peroxidase I)